MSSFRAQKRKARRVLHSALQVPAIAIHGTDSALVAVRVHSEIEPKGGVKGTSFAYAERLEQSPVLVFWRYQYEPKRGTVVSVESGEAYLVDHIEPPDDITIKAVCVRMSQTESFGLPLPPQNGSIDLSLPATWYPSGTGGSACDREFLPTPDLLTETAAHFYMGWQFQTDWLVRRKERNAVAYTDATRTTNPSFPDLQTAFVDPAVLAYY